MKFVKFHSESLLPRFFHLNLTRWIFIAAQLGTLWTFEKSQLRRLGKLRREPWRTRQREPWLAQLVTINRGQASSPREKSRVSNWSRASRNFATNRFVNRFVRRLFTILRYSIRKREEKKKRKKANKLRDEIE